MKAIVITAPGGPEVLQLREVPLPQPGSGQVRLRVAYAGLNRADLLQRAGGYPAPAGAPAAIPGLEVAGTIDAVGPDVTQWSPGQRAFGLVGGGGYAEYVVTHERLLAAIPDNLSDEEAGGVPEVFMTAHDALSQAVLRPGARVLIHAVGSGVGTAALQLVNAVSGTVLGTSRTPEKLRLAAQLGPLHSLPLPHFAEALEASDGGGPVDIVLDFVGGPYLAGNLRALASRGRLVQIGTLASSHAELDLGLLLRKRLTVIGTALRSRPLEEKALLTQSFAGEVVPLLQSGRLRAVIDRAFDLEAAADAHRYLESNVSFGKVLLRIGN